LFQCSLPRALGPVAGVLLRLLRQLLQYLRMAQDDLPQVVPRHQPRLRPCSLGPRPIARRKIAHKPITSILAHVKAMGQPSPWFPLAKAPGRPKEGPRVVWALSP
jgi:hypothetical protein